MRYCLEEMKKLLQEKLFYVFIILCLCLNIGLCFSFPAERLSVNETAGDNAVLQGEKIYDTLDANVIGSYYYNEHYVRSCVLNRWIKEKYEKLQASIDELNRENADLSYFCGEMTPAVHKALFTGQMKALLAECVIIITLLGLKSFWIERQMGTVFLVYCSSRGRKTAGDKILANGIISGLCCLFLTAVSLAVFFGNWNFKGLWDMNMASSFHYVIDSGDPIFKKPFMTWTSLTLKQYFICSMALFI